MRYFIIILMLLPLCAQSSQDIRNWDWQKQKQQWTDWKEYKTFSDSEGRPVVVISYKTKFTKAGIARIKWKIKNAATIPAKRLGIEQKFYQSSDGTTKIVSGDSKSAKKNKPFASGEEVEFLSDLFSSDKHGKITHIELRYPFFKAEFIQSDGEVLKITGDSFEAPTKGVIDCREKYGQPMITAGFDIEELAGNQIKISSVGGDAKSSSGDITFDLTTYLTSENKKALDKEFKTRFTRYVSGICGNEVKKTVTRELYDIIRSAIRSYGKSVPKKLMIKPRSAITGVRG
ncbi:hypothetical protein CXF85_10155 [Colwellia sp. 75C3]|uniref:hypothetical protein n=1 Tax=Colwellia sp. 75C3 TaxID=888425 RepID=UPI000C323BAB|nr:hypothetical protein [Colwellia sp. 75C3]PKG83851.1 hypothetical protein CXF85_10155 [Colwellia sp. 75C3]